MEEKQVTMELENQYDKNIEDSMATQTYDDGTGGAEGGEYTEEDLLGTGSEVEGMEVPPESILDDDEEVNELKGNEKAAQIKEEVGTEEERKANGSHEEENGYEGQDGAKETMTGRSSDGEKLSKKGKANTDRKWPATLNKGGKRAYCDGCKKPANTHKKGKSKNAAMKWVGCNNCDRWYIKACARGYNEEDIFYKCPICLEVQDQMEIMVAGWNEIKQKVEGCQKETSTNRNKKEGTERTPEETKKEGVDLEKRAENERERRKKAEAEWAKEKSQYEKREEQLKEAKDKNRELKKELAKVSKTMEGQREQMCKVNNSLKECEQERDKWKAGANEERMKRIEIEKQMRGMEHDLREEREKGKRMVTIINKLKEDREKERQERKSVIAELEQAVKKTKELEKQRQEERDERKRGDIQQKQKHRAKDQKEDDMEQEESESESDSDSEEEGETAVTTDIDIDLILREEEEWCRESEELKEKILRLEMNEVNGAGKEVSTKGKEEDKGTAMGRGEQLEEGARSRQEERKPGRSREERDDHTYKKQGTKRVRDGETMGEEEQGRKRGKKGCIFVGDSMIKGMVEDHGIIRKAYERRWETRMKRGGWIRDIERMVERERLREYGWLIIAGGTNDLAMDSGEMRKTIRDVVATYRRIRDHGERAGCHIIMIGPTPRKDVPKEARQELARGLMELETVKTYYVDFMGSEGGESFMRKMRPDRIHMDREQFREGLKEILHIMNEDTKIGTDTRIEIEEYWPTRCWKCGREHKKEQSCTAGSRACYRCGKREHAENVCLSLVKPCTVCGRRGHTQETHNST